MNNDELGAMRWLEQSRHDARAADVNRRERHPDIVCFVSQQAAEKALKAFFHQLGERSVIGSSVYLSCKKWPTYKGELSILVDICKELDRYYIPTRYPNALPGGIPHEVFTEEDPRQALKMLEQVMEFVHKSRGQVED